MVSVPHTNLLNVYMQIANKMGFQQRKNLWTFLSRSALGNRNPVSSYKLETLLYLCELVSVKFVCSFHLIRIIKS
jgi:hypothetical protein